MNCSQWEGTSLVMGGRVASNMWGIDREVVPGMKGREE